MTPSGNAMGVRVFLRSTVPADGGEAPAQRRVLRPYGAPIAHDADRRAHTGRGPPPSRPKGQRAAGAAVGASTSPRRWSCRATNQHRAAQAAPTHQPASTSLGQCTPR